VEKTDFVSVSSNVVLLNLVPVHLTTLMQPKLRKELTKKYGRLRLTISRSKDITKIESKQRTC
jgi:hypothetical protein